MQIQQRAQLGTISAILGTTSVTLGTISAMFITTSATSITISVTQTLTLLHPITITVIHTTLETVITMQDTLVTSFQKECAMYTLTIVIELEIDTVLILCIQLQPIAICVMLFHNLVTRFLSLVIPSLSLVMCFLNPAMQTMQLHTLNATVKPAIHSM